MIDNFKFGQMVFNDDIMQKKLPEEAYLSLKKSIDEGVKLEPSVANIVANAMKDWAIENGATHYCHWFMPMTGSTSEKHDAFLSLKDFDKPVYEFNGKNLTRGESDASSFPSGGLRATCEARGYTSWDCTSPAFIRDGSLIIPTAFCSYTGEALDKKTPLLRSMDVLSNAAVRMLDLLGYKDVKRVFSVVGAEQEYFLVDKNYYDKRIDLMFCGRTLTGMPAPKGQELSDHYFGSLKPRVSAFMKEVDLELWKLGVAAKTKHNEVAPAQHEIAPFFEVANVAADNNYLTMDVMKKVAIKHGLVCLLHEKPFAGVNGSGKHNNWSMMTDSGINLLDAGRNPEKNIAFLLSVAAIISAINRNPELLLMSVAGSGNDLRLGGNEAPPNILSVYLGEGLTKILDNLKTGKSEDEKISIMHTNVTSLLDFAKDNSDRNRTSPFAFTGNKFEFRMVGASASVAGPTAILNAVVADAMEDICQKLEGSKNKKADAFLLAKEIIAQNERIIFNGNNYAEEWQTEAKKRGLPIIGSTVDGLKVLLDKQKTEVLVKTGTFLESELRSRYEIYMGNYVKTINVEAKALSDMLAKQIIPAANCFIASQYKIYDQAPSVLKQSLEYVFEDAQKAARLCQKLSSAYKKLNENVELCLNTNDILTKAIAYRDKVIPVMNQAREYCDALEAMIPAELWPIPSYIDLLYRV